MVWSTKSKPYNSNCPYSPTCKYLDNGSLDFTAYVIVIGKSPNSILKNIPKHGFLFVKDYTQYSLQRASVGSIMNIIYQTGYIILFVQGNQVADVYKAHGPETPRPLPRTAKVGRR